MKNWINQFVAYITNGIFITLDILGITLIVLSSQLDGNVTLLSLGTTFLALGITIPLTLAFQTIHSSENFENIRTCIKSGIVNIFESRKSDDAYNKLRKSIDKDFQNTRNARLFGIAFPELLDPEVASGSTLKRQLKNIEIDLKIIVLNPDSKAAKRRADIEDPDKLCEEGETICNIKNTINNHLKLLIRSRLEKKYGKDWKKEIISIAGECGGDILKCIHRIKKDIKIEVKLSSFDPISFIIATDNSLFTEQYHFGRARCMEYTTTCIGGHLPILQYKNSSKGYDILMSHFDYVWTHENVKEITDLHLTDIYERVLSAQPSGSRGMD